MRHYVCKLLCRRETEIPAEFVLDFYLRSPSSFDETLGADIPAMVRTIISKEMVHLLPKVPFTVLRFESFEETGGLLTDHFPEHRNSEGWNLMWFNPKIFKRKKTHRNKSRLGGPKRRRLRNKRLRSRTTETEPAKDSL